MDTQEHYVDKFYNYMSESNLMGQKCADCGSYNLFPVPVCKNCKGTNLKWTQLSGKGKVLLFSVSYYPPARWAKLAPCAFGSVQLDEGPVFWTLVEGIDIKNPVKEFMRLPIPVDIVIQDLIGNHIPTAKVR